jgi:hypothetical protein
VIALTIADVFESHKSSQSDKPSPDNAKAGNLSLAIYLGGRLKYGQAEQRVKDLSP